MSNDAAQTNRVGHSHCEAQRADDDHGSLLVVEPHGVPAQDLHGPHTVHIQRVSHHGDANRGEQSARDLRGVEAMVVLLVSHRLLASADHAAHRAAVQKAEGHKDHDHADLQPAQEGPLVREEGLGLDPRPNDGLCPRGHGEVARFFVGPLGGLLLGRRAPPAKRHAHDVVLVGAVASGNKETLDHLAHGPLPLQTLGTLGAVHVLQLARPRRIPPRRCRRLCFPEEGRIRLFQVRVSRVGHLFKVGRGHSALAVRKEPPRGVPELAWVQQRHAVLKLRELGHRHEHPPLGELVDPGRRLILQLDLEYGVREVHHVAGRQRGRHVAAPVPLPPRGAPLPHHLEVSVDGDPHRVARRLLVRRAHVLRAHHGHLLFASLPQEALDARQQGTALVVLGEPGRHPSQVERRRKVALVDGAALLDRLVARPELAVHLPLHEERKFQRVVPLAVPPHPHQRREVVPQQPVVVHLQVLGVVVHGGDLLRVSESLLVLGNEGERPALLGLAALLPAED
mmetsp:Transcript_3223/g.11687  ORF Transcript_3223/g.11687 Transcript_3223/m.11687 type:complete len:510 (+) Transcript_3223:71-1600(+)